MCAFFKRQKDFYMKQMEERDGGIIYSYISERGTGRSIVLINYKWASVLNVVRLPALAHSTELSVIFQLTETLTSWMTNPKRCLKITRLRTHKKQSMYSGFLWFSKVRGLNRAMTSQKQKTDYLVSRLLWVVRKSQ